MKTIQWQRRDVYHGQEETEFRVQIDVVAIGEDERGFLLLFTPQNDVDLLGSHREHRQFNTVELIETTPGA